MPLFSTDNKATAPPLLRPTMHRRLNRYNRTMPCLDQEQTKPTSFGLDTHARTGGDNATTDKVLPLPKNTPKHNVALVGQALAILFRTGTFFGNGLSKLTHIRPGWLPAQPDHALTMSFTMVGLTRPGRLPAQPDQVPSFDQQHNAARNYALALVTFLN